jgi:hypothetical protein
MLVKTFEHAMSLAGGIAEILGNQIRCLSRNIRMGPTALPAR